MMRPLRHRNSAVFRCRPFTSLGGQARNPSPRPAFSVAVHFTHSVPIRIGFVEQQFRAYSYCMESAPVISTILVETAENYRHAGPDVHGPAVRIVQAVESGGSIRGAARRFAVSRSAAIKLMQRVRASGSAAPARSGGHRRPVLAPHEAPTCAGWSRRRPISPWPRSRPSLQRRCGVRAGLSTIHNALRRIGLRLKKVPESGRAGPARRRRQAPALAGLAALHGPGPVRVPRRDGDRHQHGQALRSQPLGSASGRGRAARPLAHHHVHRRAPATGILAPLVLDGPLTGIAFRAYVEQSLAPALEPGDVVVLDNLAAHKIDGRSPGARRGWGLGPLPAALQP